MLVGYLRVFENQYYSIVLNSWISKRNTTKHTGSDHTEEVDKELFNSLPMITLFSIQNKINYKKVLKNIQITM